MESAATPIRVLLFDLGGVLVHFDAITPMMRLTEGRFTPAMVRRFWMTSRAIDQHERGLMGTEEFAAAIMKEIGISMPLPDFIEEYKSWEAGPYPGGKELLGELRKKYRLACLSNNNPLHWDIIGNRDGWAQEFEQTFLSFELKAMKPEPAIFEAVLKRLGCRPDEVFFVDDTAEHIDGAAKLGIRGAQVSGVEGVRSVLRHLALL